MKVYKKNYSNKSPHRIDFVPDAFDKLKNNFPTFKQLFPMQTPIPTFHLLQVCRNQSKKNVKYPKICTLIRLSLI